MGRREFHAAIGGASPGGARLVRVVGDVVAQLHVRGLGQIRLRFPDRVPRPRAGRYPAGGPDRQVPCRNTRPHALRRHHDRALAVPRRGDARPAPRAGDRRYDRHQRHVAAYKAGAHLSARIIPPQFQDVARAQPIRIAQQRVVGHRGGARGDGPADGGKGEGNIAGANGHGEVGHIAAAVVDPQHRPVLHGALQAGDLIGAGHVQIRGAGNVDQVKLGQLLRGVVVEHELPIRRPLRHRRPRLAHAPTAQQPAPASPDMVIRGVNHLRGRQGVDEAPAGRLERRAGQHRQHVGVGVARLAIGQQQRAGADGPRRGAVVEGSLRRRQQAGQRHQRNENEGQAP